MNLSHPSPLLIIGGGIGGLGTALALARTGQPTHVLERAPQFAEIGAGLQLGPNGLRVLAQLGLYERVVANAVLLQRAVVRDAESGKVITELSLTNTLVPRYGYPYAAVHRADLLEALLEECQRHPLVRLNAGSEVVAVEQAADEVTVVCKNGDSYQAPAVIGADGLHSAIRAYVHGDAPAECSQFVAYRGTVRVDQLPPGVRTDSITLWLGHDYHLMQYPIRSGELFNQVAVFRSDSYDPDTDLGGTTEELDARFAQAIGPVRECVQLVGRDRRWALFDRSSDRTWHRERVLLVGDAAHPMQQYLAQGAGQALEDAVSIASHIQTHGMDFTSAFKAHESSRLPRATAMQTYSRFWGELSHVGGPAKVIRDAYLRLREPDDMTYLDWLYADPPRAEVFAPDTGETRLETA
ncbi:FAD-dependent monooxygenase [Nocardia sp. NPDC052278]|uniref:FAD-dependent monooxygenase n=1 Tax=unclassified Nocardia TaxID=2637762 RepID=UPI0036B6B48A